MSTQKLQQMHFYPIVNSFSWVQELVLWGVKTIQLRIKTDNIELIEEEIKKSIQVCNKNNCQLFINDYWMLAIKYQAFGVHLGYEDAQKADIKMISQKKLKIGLSTHEHMELNFALSVKPDYIALGPIFPTQTKNAFCSAGFKKIKEWKKIIPNNINLVAIGGIKLSHAKDIYFSGADSISVISDITHALNPEERVRSWLKLGESLWE